MRASTVANSCRCRHLSTSAFDHRSEEHTSELQSCPHLVCRLLLEKKKPSTSETSTWAPRNGRRQRTSAGGFSCLTTYWRIQVFSSRTRSWRSFPEPICSRCSPLME